ncbi:MAG: HlyD family efflux transporter periplasmic adaptor subunit [Candidatus Sulfotelmatobacter sp.]
MNLSEVLNVALPELPARRIGKSFLRLHPKVIAREQIEGGVPTFVAMVSGGSYILRFSPEQWKLVQLFNGERSHAQVAELFRAETGIVFTEQEMREFADPLEECGFWYTTTLDLSTTASQKLADERRRRAWKNIDLACMTFSTWDPDRYLTRLHARLSFVYTKWFTLLTLGAFAVMALIFLSGWREIWRDTIEYYTFSNKSAADLAEFWLLFCGLGYFHECAHGLTCKHFGGAVHSMGFMLVYLSPAFFCDVGEVYVYGGKWPRVAAILAGIWMELMFCCGASIVWWGTPAGSPFHDFAYKIMLITGVAVVLMNLNPLLKLDGYYLFGELIGIPTIKEDSTDYLSNWVKRHVFRLPVDVPYLRRRRRALFVVYGLLSGLYSYVILFAVVHFVYNIFSGSHSQWGFVPALLLAIMILRARLRSSARFMKDFYLDKRQSLRRLWDSPYKTAAVCAAVALVLFAPVWRETVSGRFALEPERRAMIRAAVPGVIIQVLANEGMAVAAGTPLLLLGNVRLENEADAASFQLRTAEAKAREAQMNYTDVGAAQAERAFQAGRSRSVAEQVAALQVTSPISGVVATPRLRDRVGLFVQEGDLLAAVDDDRMLDARIFIPEYQVQRIRSGATASLKLASLFQPIRGQVSSVAPASSELDPGLARQEKYKGIAPPTYYVVTVPVFNAGGMLRSGMSGDAKIQVSRQSIASAGWRTARELFQRKVW